MTVPHQIYFESLDHAFEASRSHSVFPALDDILKLADEIAEWRIKNKHPCAATAMDYAVQYNRNSLSSNLLEYADKILAKIPAPKRKKEIPQILTEGA